MTKREGIMPDSGNLFRRCHQCRKRKLVTAWYPCYRDDACRPCIACCVTVRDKYSARYATNVTDLQLTRMVDRFGYRPKEPDLLHEFTPEETAERKRRKRAA